MTTTEHPADPSPAEQPKRPAADHEAPILPMWARDKATFTSTSRQLTKRSTYRLQKFLLHLPSTLFWLLGVYPWRGLARIVTKLSRYLYDYDSAMVRHEHAGRVETADYVRAQNVRKANLKARWMVAGTCALFVVGPPLAWTFPAVLSGIVGVVLAVWVIKLIPGRSMTEVVIAAAAGWCTYHFGPSVLYLLPRPQVWAVAPVLTAGWLGLGFLGRPEGKPLVSGTALSGGIVPALKAPFVMDALTKLGIGGMSPKDIDSIRLLMDVARSGPGYQVDLELPPGVPASAVVDNRDKLSAALRRELGCVWPTRGRRHEGHLSLYVSDQPLSQQRQQEWPLLRDGEVDLFKPVPAFTNSRGRWVDVILAYTSWVIGAIPRIGKTFCLRQLLLIAGLDPRAKVYAIDGKGTGDLSPCALFAHFYSVGDEPEEVERVLGAFRALRDEMRRRARVIRELSREECPESKVTSVLASRRELHLEPIVIGIDETQVYFEDQPKPIRDEFVGIVTDLVKRGPALGIIVLMATQNVTAKTIPTAISNNAVARFCMKVFGYQAVDQILGTGAYKSGLDAQMFDFDDKGIGYLRADGAVAEIVRTVRGLDAVRSEKVGLRARHLRALANRLTGDAADDVMDEEAAQVVLLDDVRGAFGQVDAVHLADLVTGLAGIRPELYGHLDVFSLGKLLRSAGVEVDTVYVAGKAREEASRKGVKREWLNVSTTEVIGEPDRDEDEG